MVETFPYNGNFISIETPQADDMIISFTPSVAMLDFVVYVIGATGAWFGFAFIHIDLDSSFNALKSCKMLKRTVANVELNDTNMKHYICMSNIAKLQLNDNRQRREIEMLKGMYLSF